MDYGKWSVSDQKSQQIYHFIRANDSVSKQDIVVGLKISLPTITRKLQRLTELGLIDTSLKILNTGGRNATAYTYVKNAKLAIGVFLSANTITVVSVDLSGDVVETVKHPMIFNLEDDAYLKTLGDLVEKIKVKSGVKDEDLLGVGIAVQGLVSDDGEKVTYGLTLNFSGKTRAHIAKYIPYTNRLFHDSEIAGFAEVWIDRDLQDAFYISLSNSVGGVVVLGKKPYCGDSNKGGEIGHMVVVPQGGKQCYCGKYGCFDTVCRTTNLSDYADGSLDRFFELWKQKDPTAQKLWRQYLADLAVGVHNVRMLFSGKIILGGYVGAYIGACMKDLCILVDERNPFGEKSKDYLLPCKYKVEAAAAGAAISYINEFFERI